MLTLTLTLAVTPTLILTLTLHPGPNKRAIDEVVSIGALEAYSNPDPNPNPNPHPDPNPDPDPNPNPNPNQDTKFDVSKRSMQTNLVSRDAAGTTIYARYNVQLESA